MQSFWRRLLHLSRLQECRTSLAWELHSWKLHLNYSNPGPQRSRTGCQWERRETTEMQNKAGFVFCAALLAHLRCGFKVNNLASPLKTRGRRCETAQCSDLRRRLITFFHQFDLIGKENIVEPAGVPLWLYAIVQAAPRGCAQSEQKKNLTQQSQEDGTNVCVITHSPERWLISLTEKPLTFARTCARSGTQAESSTHKQRWSPQGRDWGGAV